MANVLGFFKKIAPMLMTGLEMAGPPGVLAANILTTGLKLTDQVGQNPTPDKVINALSTLSLTPEQQQALVDSEQTYQVQMAAMGYKDAADMEALAVQDRASARQREITVRDYTPEIGFYLLVAVFGAILYHMLKWPVPDSNRAIIYSATGSLATIVIMAATYF